MVLLDLNPSVAGIATFSYTPHVTYLVFGDDANVALTVLDPNPNSDTFSNSWFQKNKPSAN
jgi:hypothetical protein